MRTISSSTSRVTRGLPGPRRAFEPSNLPATSLRYQARMVSGLATVATSARAWRPRPMTDLPEHRSLGVRELQSSIQLALQDAVFRGQIFVPRQQLLIHRPANVGKDARPVHNGPLGPTVVPEWRRH